MGAIEELQEKYEVLPSGPAAVAPGASGAEVLLEKQLRWQSLQTGYVKKVHADWWGQMPLGDAMNKLSQYSLAQICLVEHLEQLFKIESLGPAETIDHFLFDLCVASFENWQNFVQQLGLMMLSVPLAVEIDGKVKKPFVESFGPFAEQLQGYASIDGFKAFYKGVTFRHLRMLKDAPEVLLKEASFNAWAMVSLVLPKGVTQRVHLTIDPQWVSEIQALRGRFDHPEILEYTRRMLPVIAKELAKQ